MAIASKTAQLAAMLAFGMIATEASAKNFSLTMQSAQVAKRIKTARPVPPARAQLQSITTTLACKGGSEQVAWSCPGIKEPGTLATLTYRVSFPN